MHSFNHYAYGVIGDWLYRVVAGINTDVNRPGFKHIIGIIYPKGYINGLLGLDLLMKVKAVIDLGELTLKVLKKFLVSRINAYNFIANII